MCPQITVLMEILISGFMLLKDNGDIISITSNTLSIAYLEGQYKVKFDTQVSTPTFSIYDNDTKDYLLTDDLTPRVAVTNDADVIAWALGEMQMIQPSLNSTAWRLEKPYEYTFVNIEEGAKLVYLWVKDRAGNISAQAVTYNIIYTQGEAPEAELANFARVDLDSGQYLKAGDYTATINLNLLKPLAATPTFWLHYDEVLATDNYELPIKAIITENTIGVDYVVTFNVPIDHSLDGEAY
ncbi:MAG: hypothetical protein OMM_14727, partial [Candidatus Magnetoglobus multicellularis str. Araruama]